MKQRINKLSTKNALIIGLPVILLLTLLLFVIKAKKENIPEEKNAAYTLLPNAEEEDVYDSKVSAYQAEEKKRKKDIQLEKQSVVKNSDFFKEVGTVEKEAIPMKKNESLGDYYERAVINNKTSTKSNRLALADSWNKQMIDSEEEESQNDLQAQYQAVKEKADQYKSEPPSTRVSKRPIEHPANSEEETKEETVDFPEEETKTPDDTRRRRQHTNKSVESNLIRAAIHGNQTVQNGSTVRMRLLDEVEIDGLIIPANELFYGVASISSDRLNIAVSNMRVSNTIRSVKFEIYDLDVIKGLNIPDGIKKELAKQAKKDVTNNIDLQSHAGGISGLLSTGLNTVKDVIKKDQNQISIPLKANYLLYIKKSK
ncbi:MAG: conjugative transposon protein TraM [Bacteroidales bacterium]|jgi:hypothetical protein|nr:conjugative transposon protein TraM [Bacteroidales bacterium]